MKLINNLYFFCHLGLLSKYRPLICFMICVIIYGLFYGTNLLLCMMNSDDFELLQAEDAMDHELKMTESYQELLNTELWLDPESLIIDHNFIERFIPDYYIFNRGEENDPHEAYIRCIDSLHDEYNELVITSHKINQDYLKTWRELQTTKLKLNATKIAWQNAEESTRVTSQLSDVREQFIKEDTIRQLNASLKDMREAQLNFQEKSKEYAILLTNYNKLNVDLADVKQQLLASQYAVAAQEDQILYHDERNTALSDANKDLQQKAAITQSALKNILENQTTGIEPTSQIIRRKTF